MSSIPIFPAPAPVVRPGRFAALAWPVDTLADQAHWRAQDFGVTQAAKRRRFSFRMLRYWYMERLLAQEAKRLGRLPRVLEVGVDRGQMKAFVDNAPRPISYATWDAADIAPNQPALEQARYARCTPLDVEDPIALAAFAAKYRYQYDVLIVLHLLEHLRQPHAAFAMLSSVLREGGIAIGGYPVLPDALCRVREWQLRRSARPHGHVSAFSPARTRRMAEEAGLAAEWMSGAFALRASGMLLEDFGWWHTINTGFGALCPGWPGELYWQLRKT
ncbi:MAG TPA: methyltransferase domain-containing protein [Usitatibacteraceae bacterium]|nr:methyltransferase domain-containing protein [Usitatibacteraceae bacterium]